MVANLKPNISMNNKFNMINKAEYIDTINIIDGYDKNNVRYIINDRLIEVIIPNNLTDYDYMLNILKFHSKKSDRIVFKFDSGFEGFNDLCEILSNNNLNRNIILDISAIFYSHILDRKDILNIDRLPNNVKVSYLNVNFGKETNLLHGGNEQTQFETWALWLEDKDFNKIIRKMTSNSKKRLVVLRTMVKEFYRKYKKELDNKSDIEKVNFVYNWCKINIIYDVTSYRFDNNYNDVNSGLCLTYNDSIETFRRKKGFSIGRARLFKNLLNNKYLGIDCYLVCGQKFGVNHDWNVVLINNDKIHYDLSVSNKNVSNVDDYGYWDINYEKSVPNNINYSKCLNYFNQKTV